MKKYIDAYYTKKNCKYSKNIKDCYIRCAMSFFMLHTTLEPMELYHQLNEQYVEDSEFQYFNIDGEEYKILVEQ